MKFEEKIIDINDYRTTKKTLDISEFKEIQKCLNAINVLNFTLENKIETNIHIFGFKTFSDILAFIYDFYSSCPTKEYFTMKSRKFKINAEIIYIYRQKIMKEFVSHLSLYLKLYNIQKDILFNENDCLNKIQSYIDITKNRIRALNKFSLLMLDYLK